LFVSNNLEELEKKLSKQFLYYFGKLLPLQYSYLNWLVVELLSIRKQKFSSSSLKTDYVRKMDFTTYTNRQQFFTLLQFLVYAQNLEYQADSLGSTDYRCVSFQVRDF
jgi:hypothetical protein